MIVYDHVLIFEKIMVPEVAVWIYQPGTLSFECDIQVKQIYFSSLLLYVCRLEHSKKQW